MRMALSLTAAAFLFSVAACAQPALPACEGEYTVVRVDQIKPGGSMQGFLAAVAGHQAWYRNHGFTNNRIVVARVIQTDKATHTAKYSDQEVITYHFNPPTGSPTGAGDAAWNAFVKLYEENSVIKSEYVTCMPKAQP